MAAPVDSDKPFHVGPPALLFAVHPNGSVFQAAADGKRFLVNSTPSDPISPPLTLIANWPTALQKKK